MRVIVERAVPIVVLLCLSLSTASADRRNYPVQPRIPSIAHSSYIIQFWLGFEYQTPSGELIDVPEPDSDSDGKTDLDSDLGLMARPTLTIGGILNHRIKWLPDIRLDYTGLNYEGSQVLDRNTTIAGVDYREGQRVNTKLAAAMFDVTLVYHPVRAGDIKRPSFIMGLGITTRFSEAQVTSRALGTWRVGSDLYDVPIIPLGYLMMDIYPYRPIGLHIVARGITDGTSRWIDGLAELRSWPSGPKAWIGLGCRYQNLKVEQDGGRGLDVQILAYLGTLGIRF